MNNSNNIGTTTLVLAWAISFYIACLPSYFSHLRAPVILIPGNGGNQLWGRVTNGSDPCLQEGEWHPLFVDVWSFWPSSMKCWSQKRTLVYNENTGKSENQPGLETKVPGWGGTDSVDYLDPTWLFYLFGNLASYMKPFTSALTGWGYQAGVDLIAAPYDWRYLPHSQNFFPRLQDLIEKAYSTNDQRKVVLVAHSLGGRYTMMFLQQQSQEWKEKHIESLISLGTSWGGASNSLEALASGYSVAPLIKPLDIRDEQRSSESNIFLMPTKFGYKHNKVMVKTPNRSYTMDDYLDFFNDIGYPVGYRRLVAMEDIRNQVTSSGIPHHCLYGHGIPTEETFLYSEGIFPGKPPGVEWGDGDGTVNIGSLRACEKWDKNKTYVQGFSSVDHLGMLSDHKVLEYLKKILLK